MQAQLLQLPRPRSPLLSSAAGPGDCRALGAGWLGGRAAAALLLALPLGLPAPAAAGLDLPDLSLAASFLGDVADVQTGFVSAFLLIFFSEIGDKTFFIAALLATRRPAGLVFLGTFGALAAMTVISVALGRVFHYADEAFSFSVGGRPLPLDDIAAAVLLTYFGFMTLSDASTMSGDDASEEQEAEVAIAGVSSSDGAGALLPAVAATFTLVFVAEWGDKSFFSTIALAAASSPLGVVFGAVAGHGAASLIAVLGGSFLAQYLSEKAIAYISGVLFLELHSTELVFQLRALLRTEDPNPHKQTSVAEMGIAFQLFFSANFMYMRT
eukprot:SM000113S24101  [mRNA]  locus=s113:393392:398260:- [translate_table: standard]